VFTTKIQKWGNSLAVRIPMYLAKKYGLRAGSLVEITNGGGFIFLRPIKKHKIA
jgi:antitoxin component of MazEF toxin-antitoxin module